MERLCRLPGSASVLVSLMNASISPGTILSLIVLSGLGLAVGAKAAPEQWSGKRIAELRTQALELITPLPEQMPGAEKDTPALVALGRQLFFDTRLSDNQSISCNSCHAVDKQRGGVDNEPTSPGAFGKRGGRNSPTVLNAGFQLAQFWDGRAEDLTEQAKGPVLNPIEMAMPHPGAVIDRLQADPLTVKQFQKAFPEAKDPVTYDNVARAIAAFERTLITRDRFDDFLHGQDTALTKPEMEGLELFLTAGCTSCHNGPVIGGNSYQKVGLINPYENKSDKGRFDVTKDEDDLFKFKVPMLRNVGITGPYFHDGQVAELEAVVKKMGWMQLGREFTPAETKSLAVFLRSLTGKDRKSGV